MLEIRLLGQFHVQQDGKVVQIPSRPAQSLLAYLVLTAGTAHRREKLAGLFWPDSAEANARSNLRHALWRLRKVLAASEDYISADDLTVAFHSEADVWLDTAVLNRKIREDPSLDELQDAVSVYKGELLPGFYQEWTALERERLQAVFEQKMVLLLEGLVRAGRWSDVVDWGEHWIAHGQVPEAAYRALMMAHAALGDRAGVAAVYQRCTEVLARELGVEPAAETTALYERIRAGGLESTTTFGSHPRGVKPQRPAFLKRDTELAARPPEPFVGRDAEMARLKDLLETALTARGRVAFVSGEAGWGKTRLLAEFSRLARQHHPDLIVASGICTAFAEIGDPYLSFREIFGMLCADVEQDWAAGRVTRHHAQQLWRFLPRMVEALLPHGRHLIDTLVPGETLVQRCAAHESLDPGLLEQLEEVIALRRAQRQHSGINQQRIFEEVAHVLHAASTDQPLLLILDDLQWADISSLSLLFHLGRRIADSHILILGAYRPEDLSLGQEGKEHPLVRVLAEFKRLFGDVWVSLGPDEGEGRGFVDALLDGEPNRLGEEFRERLAQNTRGHPLFTIEILRDMKAQGVVYRDESGRWVERPKIDWDALPRRVEGVIEQRVSRLDPRLKEALVTASVEGEDFTAEVVARVCRAAEGDMVDLLSGDLAKMHYLVQASGVLRVGDNRISRYRFSHNLFQKYLYHTLDPVKRAYLHEAVGKALELVHDGHTEEICVQLASHFQEAGRAGKAIQYLKQAGDAASHVYANAEAIAHYSQAIDLARQIKADGEVLIPLYMGLGRALELDSQFDRVLATYEAMEKLARERGDRRLELASLIARTTIQSVPTAIHDPEAVQFLGQRALALAGELGDKAAEAEILLSLSLANYFTNRLSQAIDYGERSLALARKLDLRQQSARTLNDLGGLVYLYSGRISQAKAALQEAGDLWRSLGNTPMLADSLSGSCIAHVYTGEYERAMALSEEAFQISQAIENRWGQSYSRWTIGDAFRARGEYNRAIEVSEECIRLGELAGFLAPQTYTRTRLAAVYGDLGAVERGIRLAQLSLSLARRHLRVHCTLVLGVLAHLHVLNGDLPQAETAIAEGKKEALDESWAVFYLPVVRAEAELALRRGEYERAVAATDDLLARLRQYGMRSGLPEALYLQGRALLGLDQKETARVRFLKARLIAEEIGERQILWRVLGALSQLEGDWTEAESLRNGSREIVQYIADHIFQDALRASFLSQPNVRTVLEAVES